MCLTQNSSIYLNRIFFFFWHFDQLQHFLQFHQQVLERENKVEMEFLSNMHCGQRWLHGAGLRIQIRQLAARRGRSSVGPSRMAAVAGSESAVGDLGRTERLSQEYRVPPAPVQTVSGPRSQGRRPSHSPGLSSARSLPFLAT